MSQLSKINSDKQIQTFNVELAVLRILATLLVFVLHAQAELGYIYIGAPIRPGREITFFLDSMARVAVSIFFMLSGYFLSQRKNGFSLYSVKHFIWVMLMPFIFYSGIYYMRKVYLGELDFNIVYFINMLTKEGTFGYHLWYFVDMIPIYFLWLFITPIKCNNKKQTILALFLVISALIYNFMGKVPFSIKVPFTDLFPQLWMLYLVLGSIFIPYILNENKIKSRWFFIAYLILTFYLYRNLSIKNIWNYTDRHSIGVLLQTLSFTGFVLTFPYPKISDKMKKVLKTISNSCLSFYGWHVFFIISFTNYERLQAERFSYMIYILIISFLSTMFVTILEQLFVHKVINPLIGSKIDRFCRDFDNK